MKGWTEADTQKASKPRNGQKPASVERSPPIYIDDTTPAISVQPRSLLYHISTFPFADNTVRVVFPKIDKRQVEQFIQHCQEFKV